MLIAKTAGSAGADPEKLALDKLAAQDAAGHARGDSQQDDQQHLPHDESDNAACSRAQGHADVDFPRAAGYYIGQDAVQSHHRPQARR